MKQLWYPFANRSQTFDNLYPGMLFSRIDGIIFHTTEGTSWPPYAGGASAPTITARPNFDTQRVEFRQHFQINRSARALAGTVDGLSTNRYHIVQIECIGTSGWATTQNPRRSYTLPDKYASYNFPDWYLKGLGDFVKWLNVEWNMPLNAPMKFVPWTQSNRMSDSQWKAFVGLAGHQHVPRNDHTDPGLLNISKVIEYAKSVTPATKPATPPAPSTTTPSTSGGYDMANIDEATFKRWVKEACHDYLTSASGALDAARAVQGTGGWGDIDNDKVAERPIDLQYKGAASARDAKAMLVALREDLLASGVIKQEKDNG